MSDAFLGFIAHPFAIVAHVLGQALRALPSLCTELAFARVRVHRGLANKLRRNLYHRFTDKHSDRIQIARVSFESEPLCLQWQRAAAGKRIVKRGKLVPIEQLFRARMTCVVRTSAPPALPDFLTRTLKYFFVRRVLPLYQLFDDLEEPLTFFLLSPLGRKQIRIRRGIIHHLRKNHSARRRKRPSRPPKVQRTRMPVSN